MVFMRIKVLFLIIISFAALTLGKFSMAHHGFAAYSNERITVQAVITELRFINPHVQLYFTIEGDAGHSESWQAELTAPNKLARGGWTKNTLKPGDQIQISGEAARNDGRSIRIREIILSSGESLPLREILD
jgi:hypothetical protein